MFVEKANDLISFNGVVPIVSDSQFLMVSSINKRDQAL